MKTVAQIGCRSFKDMSQVYQIFCNLIINYKFNEQRCKRAYEIVNAIGVSVVAVVIRMGERTTDSFNRKGSK